MENAWVSKQFPIARKNAAKPIVWGERGKLVLILFPQYKCFFLMRFPSYGVLHHMGNACVSPSIPHNIRQCSEIL